MEREYLYSAKTLDRIGICENIKKMHKIKEIEAEAKELEETDPKEAIKLYEYLNTLRDTYCLI